MAKRMDQELFDRLRAGGLRKSVARMISEAAATGKGAGGRAELAARGAISELRSLADELEDRLPGRGGGAAKKRSAAAQKAANTRKRQATARSTAAKKAASTRAKKSTSSRSTASRSSSSGTRRRSAAKKSS